MFLTRSIFLQVSVIWDRILRWQPYIRNYDKSFDDDEDMKMFRDSLIPYYFSPGIETLHIENNGTFELFNSGGGIGTDKYLEDLVTTPMKGIDNGEEWKIKTGIYWERERLIFTQSVKRHHLHLEGTLRNFPNSDRYKGLYEMVEDYDFIFWWRLSRCHNDRKKV